MSEPVNDSTAKGKWNEAVGNVKQSVGEAVGNDKMANEGAADQVKGQAQQTWGSVKDGFSTEQDRHEETSEAHAHNARESVVSGAEKLKNSIENGVDHMTHRNDK